MSTVVHRCSFCGAPLAPGTERVVTCEYCAAENEIVASGADGDRLAKAIAESESMQADCDAKTAMLSEKMSEAMTRGDKRAALKYMEGMMRMAYAPTVQMYRSFDPSDPKIVAALKQIDAAIDQGMSSTAESWGVEYIPVSEREGSPPSHAGETS